MIRPRRLDHAALTLGFALLAVVWGGALGYLQIAGRASPLDGLEYLSLDARFRLAGPRAPPDNIVIVALDDETTALVGAFPPPRDALAKIVSCLAAAQASAVAVDVAFIDPGQAGPTQALAAALGSMPTVIAAVGRFGGGQGGDKSPLADLAFAPRPSVILWPTEKLRDASHAGLVNLATDGSGAPRFVPLLYGDGEEYAPSMVLETASAARQTGSSFGEGWARLGDTTIELDLGYHLPLRFYGPRGTFGQFSAARLLAGEVAPGSLSGKTVLIGATAAAVGDRLATPFDRSMPGVEVLATGVANLIEGRGLIRNLVVRRLDAATALLLPLLAVAALSWLRPTLGLAALVAVLAIWLGAVFVAFEHDVWLAVASPLAAFAPLAFGYSAASYALDRRRAAGLEIDKATLAGFQAPALRERLLSSPDFLRAPVRLNAAVAFVDLAGFTGAAERLGPLATREFISEFQAIVGREVAAQQGVTLNFMGDGAMILFGLPDPRPDDATRALRMISALRGSLESWIAGPVAGAAGVTHLRIGANYGIVAASRLIAAGQEQITALGDCVNVASRLMEVGKQRQRAIVVSADLIAAAGAAAETVLGAGEDATVDIRGRKDPIQVRMWR